MFVIISQRFCDTEPLDLNTINELQGQGTGGLASGDNCFVNIMISRS